MVRFRRKARRRAARIGGRRSRSRSSGGSMFGSVIPAAAYGAVRGYASNLLLPVTSKLGMLGTYADNVVMIGALLGLGKVMPSMKPLARTGIIIESAMIGGEIIQQVAPPAAVAGTGSLWNGGNL